MNTYLSMRGITKRYPNGILANENVDFSLNPGEIHAIAGENGAGKSTLMKILFGAERPDEGEIVLKDQSVRISSPAVATSLGIGMVYQHFMLVDELPVWQNVFLGIEKKKGLLLDRDAMVRATEKLCADFDMPMDVHALCGSLPVGVRQKVEILKVLARGAEIIILDEPTAVLTPQETQELFHQLRLLKANGHTMIIITHKLKEIRELCDRVTIMRGGKTVGVHQVADVTEEKISELMVGTAVRLKVDKKPAVPGQTVAEFSHVTLPGPGGKPLLKDVSFQLHEGEILCLAGVEGNGQQQVVDCLTGAETAWNGDIRLLDDQVRGKSIRDIRETGLCHIPEDRMTTGTDQKADLYDNMIALSFGSESRFGLVRRKKLMVRTEEQLKEYLVKGTARQNIGMLSGGNMQKVVIARELSSGSKVIVADQPTRGVDVGAIAFIHERLVKMRDEGCAVLLVSADLGEVLSLSNRILVFRNGEIAAEVTDVPSADEQMLGRYMLGVAEGEAAQ